MFLSLFFWYLVHPLDPPLARLKGLLIFVLHLIDQMHFSWPISKVILLQTDTSGK